MAVIKIFDSKGVKTIIIQGNAMEQPYDDEAQVDDSEEETSSEE